MIAICALLLAAPPVAKAAPAATQARPVNREEAERNWRRAIQVRPGSG